MLTVFAVNTRLMSRVQVDKPCVLNRPGTTFRGRGGGLGLARYSAKIFSSDNGFFMSSFIVRGKGIEECKFGLTLLEEGGNLTAESSSHWGLDNAPFKVRLVPAFKVATNKKWDTVLGTTLSRREEKPTRFVLVRLSKTRDKRVLDERYRKCEALVFGVITNLPASLRPSTHGFILITLL
ncbi:hypothetical protein SARC_07766 [Sphaeroforma arctica JP610]|uniref:Uncharacterized protein n=1 Tax=Sphaeroforma arctica JP610 TaxID=667725 RepID=A0A0L0FT40_9EUKA|nr:hypothetical protein SARC_07766 [Sphaeroforma arctica JP610]KNC79859.1 hypothetical protein SARC_07766 [Sphaeroforma arctica JP610]|eukprot:XP_014153761.1 hypothetical protein SARC_07766 [Sphaeroforma arctica JP610]